MPYTPKPPFPKSAGNPVRSADWNELVTEVQRLEGDKLNQAGGTVSGALTVRDHLSAGANATVSGSASVGGPLDVSGSAILRSTTNVGGSLSVAGSASVTGGSSVAGAATFGGGASFAGAVKVGGSGAAADSLEVVGNTRLGTGGNPVQITSQWSNFPGPAANRAEISNDTNAFKTLMLVGNKSLNPGVRMVSVWDRLEVNGPSCATSFCNLSDGRLKTDVVPVARPLERLSRMRGVSFRWRTPGDQPLGASEPSQPPEPSQQPQPSQPAQAGVGVIAQEVAAVFPELVTTMGTQQHLAVDYSGLTAVLVEAMKELKADNDRLRERVEALELAASAGSTG